MNQLATEILDQELADADLLLPAEERARHLAAISGVIQEFRRSELMGLDRPRSRMILIDGTVGVYAQPDFWDRREKFYEMKSYYAHPTPPDVQLQVRLFQCAFPNFRAHLAWFDRHAAPVVTRIETIPPLDPATREATLGLAYRVAVTSGVDKVLEYIDSPIIPYSLPPGAAAPGGSSPRS